MRSKSDIVEYAQKRGIGQIGDSSKKIAEIIEKSGDDFKSRAQGLIIAGKGRKNPKLTGELDGKYIGNPKIYREEVLAKLETLIDLENRFITDFVNGNNKISDKGKKYLIEIISTGKCDFINDVEYIYSVEEKEDYIEIKFDIGNFARIHILREDLFEDERIFLRKVLLENPLLSVKSVLFLQEIIKTRPNWFLANSYVSLMEDIGFGRLYIICKDGEGYDYDLNSEIKVTEFVKKYSGNGEEII